MAEWKKIVVSGSAISQLANDSGYLSGSQTIASASVAARATTLSADATASFADRATSASIADTLSQLATASFADSATSSSYALTASVALNVPATASHADRATSASIADELSQLATASFADSATTASFADLAGSARSADSASVAARATTLSADATASFADRATTASFADLAGNSRNADSASVAARATTLSADATASFADRATTASFADLAGAARSADSASVAARATELSADATASFADRATTASFADLAGNSRNADSASVAARATTLSADATASFADLAGTVHDGNITTAKLATDSVTTAKIVDGNVTNAKLANDSLTIGATEITLGTTATELVGLTNISATTGSFVLQIFESSSTIITSGSNIFGDTQLDKQQFTGSILQTGSFTTTGTVTANEVSSDKFSGSFSGSFQGDGSNLTGIATVLTVDGDSGTQDVDLLLDDLQIIGTANEIETAVTKVGTDVKVTIGLPTNITVTASFADLASAARSADSASVAARATTLSPAATASFADRATSASIADELSQLATASFAITASHALNVPATASHALTAVTASIADELSGLATASFADSATSASQAENATSASAIFAGALFPTTLGLEGQGLALDSNKNFIFGDFFGTGSTKKLNQSSAAVTWSFAHNLNELYPIVQVYDSNGDQLIPERINSVDANNVEILFAEASTGVAAAMVGGMGVSASNATRATSASIADEASTLSATATASFADLASTARTADSASVAARATLLSADATASFADLASAARTATTASHALGGAGNFSGSFIGDGSGLTGVASDFNFQGDTGATTISLTTETASFVGTAGEIETTVTANQLQIGLPSNVTIGNNLTVTNDAVIAGNLTVGGSLVSASSLEVADQFIILASGSTSAIDGGIIVNQQADPDGKGQALAYDASANRWALQTGLNDTASAIVPDAYVGVIQEFAGAPSGNPTYGGTSGKGTIFVDTSNNEAYIYI